MKIELVLMKNSVIKSLLCFSAFIIKLNTVEQVLDWQLQKIIDCCGGSVGIESKPGEESTFFFTIPKPFLYVVIIEKNSTSLLYN
jgi:hypothetical protein